MVYQKYFFLYHHYDKFSSLLFHFFLKRYLKNSLSLNTFLKRKRDERMYFRRWVLTTSRKTFQYTDPTLHDIHIPSEILWH